MTVRRDTPVVALGLPTGTVTFLFTDVERSTNLLHELGERRYAEALAEHRRIVRDTCAGLGGVEVDTQGDAFFFAFRTAPAAVEAAAAIAAALREGALQVRIGLHTGAPLTTVEGYVGVDVHRAARIAAAASGGQVVASSATRALVSEKDFLDLGLHRFKDLAAPEHVYQLGSGDFPPLKSLPATNMPAPATPFVGRSEELMTLGTKLVSGDASLLTLAGPGGSGKTRLALQAAGEVADAFPGGVFWVSLTPLRDPALVPSLVIQALGASDVPEGRVDIAFAERTRRGRALVLADNCEHLLPGVARAIAAIREVPEVTVLATSRERLQLQGEHVFEVLPLSKDDAVELFLARAAAVGAGVSATEEVRELCRRLDELPLALELAAARSRLFSPRQLLERLGERLDLLRGGRDTDPRQQTLRATIEWSHELLNLEEQHLFRRLAIFPSGCTFLSAETVCDADPDTLQSLIDKSLVRRRDDTGEPRYWMLETIRSYALERLEGSGEAPLIQARHAEHFVGDPLDVERFWSPGETPARLRRVNDELDNIRAALDWAHEQPSPLELALAVLYQRADAVFPAEGRRRLEEALENQSRQRPRLRARALAAAGGLARQQGESPVARRHLEESVELYRDVHDSDGEDEVLSRLVNVVSDGGDEEEAMHLLSLLEERAREREDWGRLAFLVGRRAVGTFVAGDRREGRRLADESVALMERVEAGTYTEAVVRLSRARLSLVEGRVENAIRDCEISIGVLEPFGDDYIGKWDATDVLAAILARVGELTTAVRLYACVEARQEARGVREPRLIAAVRKEANAPITAVLAAPELAAAEVEGRRMSLREALALGQAALQTNRTEHLAP